MKLFLFALTAFSLFASSQAFAACNSSTVIAAVEKYSEERAPRYGTKFKSVTDHGTLAPGQKMHINISVDDFDVTNNRSSDILVVSLYGHNLIGATFWLAELDPETCRVWKASEVLGEGGAGL